MSKFEVGKRYDGWTNAYGAFTPSIVVVQIADDRKTLLATHCGGAEPRAYEYKVVVDPRFGEKISLRGPARFVTVFRADKVRGDGEIPAGWFSDKKRRREDAARKAKATREKTKFLMRLADEMTIDLFARIVAAQHVSCARRAAACGSISGAPSLDAATKDVLEMFRAKGFDKVTCSLKEWDGGKYVIAYISHNGREGWYTVIYRDSIQGVSRDLYNDVFAGFKV